MYLLPCHAFTDTNSVIRKTSFLRLIVRCRYAPFIVAETSIPGPPAGEGGSAFNTLAGYLFGKNKTEEKMSMTMPVFTDNGGKMQFVLKARKVRFSAALI